MLLPRRFLPLLFALTVLLPCAAAARVLEVGPGKPYDRPSQAIAAAHDGDTVLIAAGTYTDCATVSANHLVIQGADPAAPAVLTGRVCAGKALLVTTGSDITLRNLTLTGAHSVDNNGAGIRAEGNGLTVDHVSFIDNQDGILSAPRPEGTITIRDSSFLRNGVCNPVCAHGIYIGPLKLLRVENSVFTQTMQGHHIKSRAARTEVIGCRITDGPDGTASYEIDIPNGGAVVLRGNSLEKGPLSQNQGTVISIGEEGNLQPASEITIADNVFRNDGSVPTTFVVNTTPTPAILTGNVLSGAVTPLKGLGTVR